MRFAELLTARRLLSTDRARTFLGGPNQDPAWFGTLAFLLGYLGRDDIDRVLLAQRSSGLRFGEQAVLMGLLDAGEKEKIVRLQDDHRVLFVEVAWALEELESEEIAELLADLLATG